MIKFLQQVKIHLPTKISNMKNQFEPINHNRSSKGLMNASSHKKV